MKLFDETRICSSGLTLRDLVMFSALYVSAKAILMAVTNALLPTWPVPYRVMSKIGLVYLTAEFIAIPILGLIAAWIVHRRFRIVAQVLAIFFFHGIVAYTVVRFIE